MNKDWSDIEAELIVKDYFSMLMKEIQGVALNKTEHRKRLLPFLNGRSEGSVEFKYANISAALITLGLPYIKGYKPRYNFQKATLLTKIQEYLVFNPNVTSLFTQFVNAHPKVPVKAVDFDNWVVAPPEPAKNVFKEPLPLIIRPVKINYLEREQHNQDLGFKGEQIVMEYERYKLINAGKYTLADKVEWVSRDRGDGLGFDILSKNLSGTDKYIEVKTTKLTRESPFFFTSREFQFSLSKSQDFHLYRVFDFNDSPKMFSLNGSYDQFCKMEAVQYRGWV